MVANGRIAETGTHETLIGARGEYARLWSAYEAAHAWRIRGAERAANPWRSALRAEPRA